MRVVAAPWQQEEGRFVTRTGACGNLDGMYGVPASLPLAHFIGQELNQIAIGRFQVQLHFSGTGSISIEGSWELRDAQGTLVDKSQDHVERDCYRVHRVLDLPVERFEIDPPRSFTLVFSSGHSLTVFDDSEQYESFSVHLNGLPSSYI